MLSTIRSLNREWLSDTAWTASMYLEAVAMLPQIFMFQKQAADEGGTVEVCTKLSKVIVGEMHFSCCQSSYELKNCLNILSLTL